MRCASGSTSTPLYRALCLYLLPCLPCCTGTGALKSGFTRTGKRTIGGILDDGVKSVTRYYVNNFQDGTKQDALDLVTGGEDGGRG